MIRSNMTVLCTLKLLRETCIRVFENTMLLASILPVSRMIAGMYGLRLKFAFVLVFLSLHSCCKAQISDFLAAGACRERGHHGCSQQGWLGLGHMLRRSCKVMKI